MKKDMKHFKVFHFRVGNEELEAIDFLARRMERKPGDAIRFVIREAARKLQSQRIVEIQNGLNH